MTNNLCKTLKDFSVVDFDAYVDAEFCKYLIYNLYKLKLVDKGFAASPVSWKKERKTEKIRAGSVEWQVIPAENLAACRCWCGYVPPATTVL